MRPPLARKLVLAAILLVAAGCARATRPEVGEDRSVDTGIPVRFGSEESGAADLVWDFGDGTPPLRGRVVDHPFARAGSFTVRARAGAEEVASVRLTVTPRPIARAVPADAAAVLYLPSVRRDLATAIDFLERLLGAAQTQRLLDSVPHLAVALEQLAEETQQGPVDGDEGLGLFLHPSWSGAVGALGVTDEQLALNRVLELLERQGGVGRMSAEGLSLVLMPNGDELGLFVDRGYLYLALPGDGDGEEDEPGEFVRRGSAERGDPLRGAVAGIASAGAQRTDGLNAAQPVGAALEPAARAGDHLAAPVVGAANERALRAAHRTDRAGDHLAAPVVGVANERELRAAHRTDDGFAAQVLAGGVESLARRPRSAKSPRTPSAAITGLVALRNAVVAGAPEGLTARPDFERARTQVAEGSVQLFSASSGAAAPKGIASIVASLRFSEGRLDLDGFVSTRSPLFQGHTAPSEELLGRAPSGAVAAAQVSLPGAVLIDLLVGPAGSLRRERLVGRLDSLGLGGAALVEAFRGDGAMLIYFDAEAFLKNLVVGSREPEPRGTLLLELGLRDADPVAQAVDRLLSELIESSGGKVTRSGGQAGKPFEFKTSVLSQSVEVRVAADRLSLNAGEKMSKARTGNAAEELRARTTDQSFRPGHASLLIDLAQLKSELEQPRQIPGVDPERTVMLQGFTSAFIERLTPIERIFADFVPEEGGGRLRGGVVLRSARR